MRVLVVGGSGMLGTDVVARLRREHEVFAPASSEFDITDPSYVALLPAGHFGWIDWCVNCAAYTAVDKAETEIQKATELNALGPAYLATACASAGTKLIHISTDFVFDGETEQPYREDDAPHPLGVYGRTKLEGERAVQEANQNSIILRTSWLYGANGRSFPRTLIEAHEASKQLRVVDDQVGCPTYTPYLADTIAEVIESNLYPGIYHASGIDAMTWHTFAARVLTAWTGEPVPIQPISTSDWPTPAKRPPFSVLFTGKLHNAGIPSMPPVDKAIADFCQRLREARGPDSNS